MAVLHSSDILYWAVLFAHTNVWYLVIYVMTSV